MFECVFGEQRVTTGEETMGAEQVADVVAVGCEAVGVCAALEAWSGGADVVALDRANSGGAAAASSTTAAEPGFDAKPVSGTAVKRCLHICELRWATRSDSKPRGASWIPVQR